MEPITTTYQRSHDLDWLRFIAILILLFFHTGMWFNSFGWHVKNNETSTSFDYWMIWLHYWRMPLLLLISGAGTYMALGKRTPGQFVGERFVKLFIPLVFGMFVVVPPQIYFEHIDRYPDYASFYKTVFEFKPYPVGSFSWHHLWFIVYLLLYSLIALPLLVYLRSPRSLSFRHRLQRILSTPAALIFLPAVFIFFTQLLLRPWFPEETHALLNDWAFFTFYFCFFLFGMLLYSNPDLWNSIGASRRYILMAAIFILIPFYGAYLHFHKVIELPFTERQVEIIFDVSGLFVSWFTVLAVVAYAQRYLNKPHRWLAHITEGLYPFYILHQTVIIWIGYYVCQWDWSIAAKFWTVSLLTLVSCLAFYFAFIRPFNVMRLLFGLKWRKEKKQEPGPIATEPNPVARSSSST